MISHGILEILIAAIFDALKTYCMKNYNSLQVICYSLRWNSNISIFPNSVLYIYSKSLLYV